MFVRLAFAVAAHLESEILIIDEVLAVGDAEFQKKCLGKMDDISKSEGRTLLFVSHNMGSIQHLCNKAVVLSAGSIAFSGEANTAIEGYLDKHAASVPVLKMDRSKLGVKNQFVEAFTADATGKPANEFSHDGEIQVAFELHLPQWQSSLVASLAPLDKHRRRIFTIDVPLQDYYTGTPTVALTVTIPAASLAPGAYSWMLYIHEPLTTLHDFHEGVCDFSILETGSVYAKYADHDYGCVYPPAFRVEPRS
jgi:lipopolysaccharide transport system ATP-binding protein